jgi:serine/threonine protein kinase/tetratricopeptide (TPR) repeat protein
VVLREQPFQILRMLVDRAGKIVTRAEIQKKLWPNDTIVDWDHSINVAIGVLRRALGDSAAAPRYIETLARRGYRLIASVEWLETRSSEGVAAVSAAGGLAVESHLPRLGGLAGKTVSHYRVLEVLGGGGMGLVYEAEDLKLGRRAALKFLPHELASDPAALKRLEREAQTASALNHPNICTIYGFDDFVGQRFIAMELLEGETLEQRLAASGPDPLPPLALLDIAIQVCAGLEAAHGKDIVHRDIKPANIFLTNQGPVKVLDFGIAKQLTTEDFVDSGAMTMAAGESSLPQIGLTRTGATVGTTGYMSPEQVRRERLDGRSDLFSLGLVVYEMATGRRAFTGETAVAVQESILTRAPPAAESVNTAIPRALATIIARALEKERSLRYQTAADMRHELEKARSEVLRPRARSLRRWLPAAAAVLAIAALAVWVSSLRSSGVTLAQNDTIVLAHLTNATGDRVFDDALYTALRISLEQTPYLNVLSDDKLRGTLAALGVDQSARITPEVALELCRRTGSKLVAAPAIAESGNRLALELKATDCQSGSTVSRIEEEAASRDDVVAALGVAAVQFRRELGEPSASVARYNAPIERATSSSPDALELLRLGYRRQLAGDTAGAIPFHKRASQADPDFAIAHTALGIAYNAVGETAAAAASARTAFALRDRMTAPTRFHAESTYHLLVTGDREQASAVLSKWVEAFPHDLIARNNLGRCLMDLGDLDRGLGQFREAARLMPAPFTYASWIYGAAIADRPDEAEKIMKEALERGFDSPVLRDLQVRLAFLRKDDAAMQRQWTWAEGRAEAHGLIYGKALVEAYHGRMRAALRSEETATALASAAASPTTYALGTELWRAEVGLSPARPIAVAPTQNLSERLRGTLVLARTGQLEQARRATDAIRQDFPTHTIVQRYGLPLIDGAIALASNDAAAAVAVLEPAVKYDLADTQIFEALYPAYVRGLAYLQSGAAAPAAAEFQKILYHPGMVGRSVMLPLATLQLARAQRAIGTDAALGSYEAFLALWQDADADIPLYRDAKAEDRDLRDRLGSAVNPR